MEISEDEAGLPWVGKHIVLFEFEVSKESVVSNSVDDLECFNVAVPMWHLDELQKDAFQIDFFEK